MIEQVWNTIQLQVHNSIIVVMLISVIVTDGLVTELMPHETTVLGECKRIIWNS